ncbi:MAG: aldo/keto reductase [Clostridiales bacterium]|jgi:predicted aldo/keto reductase-like oxidoreductase|nr:aldo/keto reductase [Clostridiales bacterium]
MKYRELGKTGKMISEIGLGCEFLDRKPYGRVKEVIDAAIGYGVNVMDIFMPGTEVRENISKAIGNRREEVFIQGHIGSTDINQQYDISRDMPTVKKYFEELLRIFGYIDFGMLFFIDSEDDYKNVFETEFITYAEHLKAQGDIRHIGFSSHNPVTAMKAIETGIPEMMMFSINPAFDMLPADQYALDNIDKFFGGEMFRGIDPKRAALYKLCTQKQVGITAMKTLGAGKLLSPDHTPYLEPLTLSQCVHYALSRPSVASVLPGCQSAEEVNSIMKYLTAIDEEKSFAEIISNIKNDFRGHCVYCSHCAPCPMEIDIAAVNKYLDIARLDENNIPPSIRSHFNALNSAECIACASCENRCPFGVPIIENIKDAKRILA